MNINVLRFDILDSTNTEAAKQARQGAEEGVCIVANSQTAGRGRLGRTWVSEPGSGLYFSIILRPQFDATYLPLITLMAGVAVADTLKELGLRPDIKWVNDVLVNDLKIAGILAEALETHRGLAVILGIGVNLTSRNFLDEIAETATSIEFESGKRITATELSEILTKYLVYFYDLLSGPEGPVLVIDEWRQRSSFFAGKSVRVTVGEAVIEGVTDGLEANGALRLRLEDGSVRSIQAGDVERLRSDADRPRPDR